jgi:hypothetical protein
MEDGIKMNLKETGWEVCSGFSGFACLRRGTYDKLSLMR